MRGKMSFEVLWQGKEASCKIADYYFTRLQRDLMKRKSKYLQDFKAQHLTGNQVFKKTFLVDVGNTYLIGIISTVSDRLDAMMDDNDTDNYVKRKEHFNEKSDADDITFDTKKMKASPLYGVALSQGREDGKSVSLSQGVNGNSERKFLV